MRPEEAVPLAALPSSEARPATSESGVSCAADFPGPLVDPAAAEGGKKRPPASEAD